MKLGAYRSVAHSVQSLISYFKYYQLFGAVQLEVLFYELHYPPNLSVLIHSPFLLLHYRCIPRGFQEYVD